MSIVEADSIELEGQLADLNKKMRDMICEAEIAKRDFTDEETEKFELLKENHDLVEQRHEQVTRKALGLDLYGSDDDAEADDAAFMAKKRAEVDGYEVGQAGLHDYRGRMTRGLNAKESIAKSYAGVHSSVGSVEQVGFGDFLRCIATGKPHNEAEKRVMAEGSDSAGGFAVPTRLAAQLLDNARAQSRVMQAGAGVVVLDSDNLRYAKITADPTAAWRAENAAAAIDDATLGAVDFAPESFAVIVKASFELADDAPNFATMMSNIASGVTAAEMDRVTLVGTGTSNEPLGLMGMTSVNEVDMGTNGLAISSYDPIIDAVQAVRDANHEAGGSMIMAPRTAAELAKLVDADSNPLTVPGDIPQQRLHTTNVPVDQSHGTATDASTIFLGDWSSVQLGIRNSMRVEVSRQRYMENLQVAYLIWMRMDVQCFYEDAMARIVGIIPNDQLIQTPQTGRRDFSMPGGPYVVGDR